MLAVHWTQDRLTSLNRTCSRDSSCSLNTMETDSPLWRERVVGTVAVHRTQRRQAHLFEENTVALHCVRTGRTLHADVGVHQQSLLFHTVVSELYPLHTTTKHQLYWPPSVPHCCQSILSATHNDKTSTCTPPIRIKYALFSSSSSSSSSSFFHS